MSATPIATLVPYETAGALPAAQLLAETIRTYLQDYRRLALSDLDALLAYFAQPAGQRLSGSLALNFASKRFQVEDCFSLEESETILFTASGYSIRTFRQEYFGDYLTCNDYRTYAQHDAHELRLAGSDSFADIMLIMEEYGGTLKVTTDRFAVTKRRGIVEPV